MDVRKVQSEALEMEERHGGKLRLVRPREAAAMLGICERTLWDLTKQGAIQTVRIKHSVRYAICDIEGFIARNRK